MDEKTSKTYDFALSSVGLYFFSKQWDSKSKLAHQIFNSIVTILIFIFTTGFIIVGTKDVILWIEGICIWNTGVISHISVGVALIFRKQFKGFLDEIVFRDKALDMPFINHVIRNSFREGKLKELKYLVNDTQEKFFKYSVWFLKGYATATCSTAVLYMLDAVYNMVVRKDKTERILAYAMWFPWKLDEWDVYIATFTFHAYGGILAALMFPCFQSIILLLVGQIIRQLYILRFILLHLDDLVFELVRERNERWQTLCTAVLSQCIHQYVTVKNFSNRLNKICRPFYLVLILDAIFLVCVCSVKIAISDTISHDLIKYCLHEFFFTCMVLFFCLLGQQVSNECEKLEYAVTEKWYMFDRCHKKNVMIFHMAISQQMPFYIFGSIPLCLPTFTWFLKTGMSFFTLVMSVLEG